MRGEGDPDGQRGNPDQEDQRGEGGEDCGSPAYMREGVGEVETKRKCESNAGLARKQFLSPHHMFKCGEMCILA